MQPPSQQDLVNTRLIDAAACGCVMQIRYALDQHAAVDTTDAQGNSALHVAAMHGHADAVLFLQQIIQPALRNRNGATSVEVWWSQLPPPRQPYPDSKSVQDRTTERRRNANALVDQLEGMLREACASEKWLRYLSEWKSVGRLDSHANPVLIHMLTKMRERQEYLPSFSDDNPLHSLSLLFELLATFAQDSFCVCMKSAQGAPAVRAPLLTRPAPSSSVNL
jgi:hypothetical protein